MALSRQKFREMVFQILYSQDIGHPTDDSMLELMMTQLAITKKNVKLAQERVHTILSQLPDIDAKIASVSISYDFDRIQTVAKNILRLGVYELFYDSSIPPKVAIAEAMRLARKFGTAESASFINALLDQLYRADQGLTLDVKALNQETQRLIQSEEQAKKVAEQLPLDKEQPEES